MKYYTILPSNTFEEFDTREEAHAAAKIAAKTAVGAVEVQNSDGRYLGHACGQNCTSPTYHPNGKK